MTEHGRRDTASDSETNNSSQEDRVESVILDHLQRRHSGDDVSDAAVIAQHQELMPEIAERLQEIAELSPQQHEAKADENDVRWSALDPRTLRIRCPHCHQSTVVLSDADFDQIACNSCGSQINLTRETVQTREAPTHKRIAHFELVERLGLGSFGTVWKARDTELDRTVAVKIPRRGQLDPGEIEKFLREARAAAQLNHKNIARVYEVGRDGDIVYIVSELIRGVSLADWLTGRHPTFREAAKLCAKLAQALHHAHESGVIHRDLKPHNIMLDSGDEPHILDFGLAKREAGEITMTMDGHVLGTPDYMSPEQARGEARQADRRTDVYSLGVILFELLSGELPFRGNARMLIHQVLHVEAPSPRKLNSNIPKDLETICLKCLEKAPHRRFESAKLLADELRRFLDGKPTLTRPISRLSRVWRWSRRNPALSGMLAASVLLAMTLAVSTLLIANQRDIAEDRLVRTTTAEREAKSALDESATAREETRRLLYVSDMNAATQAWETSNIARTLGLLNRHRPEQNQVDLRGFEWYHLWRLCYSSLSTPNIKHTEAVAALAFSPDGTKVATGSGNTVQIWNVGTRMREHTFEPHEGVVLCVAFSPDGKILATGSADKTVRLWSVDTRESLHVLPHQQWVVSVSFSRTGLLASSDHTVRLWNVSTGNSLDNLEGASSDYSVAFSPTDGRTLATADGRGSTTFWDVEKRQSDSKEGSTGHGVCVTFSSDGTLVATADADSMVRLWDVATHTQLAVFRGHSAEVMSVVFSPDGKRLASASVDSTVRLWDVESEQCSRIFRGHIGSVRVVAFSPDGKMLASGGLDSSLRFWDVIANPENPDTLSGHKGIITQVSLSPDARTLASMSTGAELRLWDLALGSGELALGPGEKVRLTTQTLNDAKFSPSGSLLALADDVNVRIRSVTSNNDVVILPEAKANCVAFSPNGNILATGSSQEDSVTLWDTETWQPIKTFGDYSGIGFAGRGLVFSPHGDLIAISGSDNTVSLWTISANLTELNLKGRLKGHTDKIVCLAFSPNGQTLATGSFDGSVRLWDVETHKSYPLRGSNGEVWSLAFSPDGKTLATSSGNVVQLWNLATKGQVANLNGHTSKVSCVLFSADGRMLVSGSFDKTIKVWRASTEHDVLNAVWMNNIQLPQQSIRRLTPYGNLNRQDAASR